MSEVIFKEGKSGMGNIYIQDVPVVYAVVQEPRDKWTPDGVPAGSLGEEYSLTAFVDEAVKDTLFDELLLNKSFFEVGVDKNKKRQIKYKLTSQVKDADDDFVSVYDPYEGLYGVSLTLPALKKNGQANVLNIIDTEGEQIADLVGNGSVCTIKLFYYTNNDDQKNVTLDTIQVKDLVAYEGGGSSGGVDDVLGVTIQQKAAPDPVQDKPSGETKQEVADNREPEPEDDDIPFNHEDA